MNRKIKKIYGRTPIWRVVVPILVGLDATASINAARSIVPDRQIILIGLVSVADRDSLSAAATLSQETRTCLRKITQATQMRRYRVLASHHIWMELCAALREVRADLLVLDWPGFFQALHADAAEILSAPPCRIALVRGPIPPAPKKVLVTLRGSRQAEFSLRLALNIHKTSHAKTTSMHVLPEGQVSEVQASFHGIRNVLRNLPEVNHVEYPAGIPVAEVLNAAQEYDLIVIGLTAQENHDADPIGEFTRIILKKAPAGVIAVKDTDPPKASLKPELVGKTAISVLVDKWFAENTYHSAEFENLEYLLELKRAQHVTISLALPALNEEKTVGNVIRTIKGALMDRVPLLDEIVLMDSNSSDRTREIAAELGLPVYIHQELLPELGSRHGKGEALWKSLLVTKGDILVWIDTDIVNIHPRFIYGLLGPLLLDRRNQFVKGFYRRPLRVGNKIQASGGGRVTELTARPLLNLFYPELSGIIQPLSGEYGGRRNLLEQLPFYSGYGVEIGLLIDIFERFGLQSIVQVDLKERIHHNQSLESLSKMSFTIIQAVIHKLERRYDRDFLDEVNKSMKLIRYEPGHFYLDVERISEQERPPMIELPEYRQVQHA